MKKLTYQILVVSAILSCLVAAKAAVVTVTVNDDGVSNIGAPNTFYWALTNCNPGDTIAFNIPGAGPHFLQPPPAGFPLIYQKHRITIDGYTQPGAVANSNPNTAANNAQIKIVIDGRNSSAGAPRATSMAYATFDGTLATSDPPINNQPWNGGSANYSPGEYALLGIYRSTNVTIKGLAFLGDNMQVVFGSSLAKSLRAICLAHDYGMATDVRDFLDYPEGEVRGCHVAGCWFGVNPTNVTKSGIAWCYQWINFPRHTGDDKWETDVSGRPNLPNVGLTVGVAPGSANPRAEFNVFVGGFDELAGEPIRLRLSGNFIGFMPDGVTPVNPMTDPSHNGNPYAANIPTYWPTYGGEAVYCIRMGEDSIHSHTNAQPIVIGTDGDGVNDADEGNLRGPLSLDPVGGVFPSQIAWPRSSVNLFLIAGNRVGVGNDGTIWTNSAYFISDLDLSVNRDGQSRLIIGSDFSSSRSAATIAAQANHFYNNIPVGIFGSPPSSLSGVVPFINYQHPNGLEQMSSNAFVSLRGNVMVGNGLAPFNYANGTGSLLTSFTNNFGVYLDTNYAIIPGLNAGSVFPNLSGTFAPGIAPYTNVIIDVYELDPVGWSNGIAFNLSELIDPTSAAVNGFPQGKKFLGSYPVANTGTFSLTLPASAGRVTVTANYSQQPAGTALAQTATSEFSMPITLLPAGVASVGLTHVVPDVACWYDAVNNYVTNGPINLANQPPAATLGNWEPWASALGDSTFLIEFNTYADDAYDVGFTLQHQNFAVAKQPAAGGPAKVDHCYYGDNGLPFKGIINLRRQNGNPGKIAGDLRYGANKFITEAEVSIGQVPAFQTVARWGNNNIYQGTAIWPDIGTSQSAAGNAYTAEQIFSLDPVTLTQTPVTNAWDYIYGNYSGVMGAANNAPQVGRTGGRPTFLDNGNIVVMADDKAAIVSAAGEVTTFAIIKPDGTIVKGPTLAKASDIFDNMCGVKGGFVIRAHNSLLFYDNNGSLTYSNDVNASSAMNFGGSPDADGRGDHVRLGGSVLSYYVFVAGGVANGSFPGSGEVGVAAWDVRTGQFVGSSMVNDGDPSTEGRDRTTVAVDALNRVCVAYGYRPDATFPYQVAARVAQFDGANFNWLTHSFYPFLNHDEVPANVKGFSTANPYVVMNTREICIAAKGSINSTNSAAAGPDSLPEQTVYTVISHPAPVAAPQPTVSVTKSGSNLIVTWNADDGLFTVQTRAAVNTGAWANATAGNVLPPVSIPAGTGPTFIRLAR